MLNLHRKEKTTKENGGEGKVPLDNEMIDSSIKSPNVYALSAATSATHLSSKTVGTCFNMCLVYPFKLSCLFNIVHLQDSHFIGHGSYTYAFEISSYI